MVYLDFCQGVVFLTGLLRFALWAVFIRRVVLFAARALCLLSGSVQIVNHQDTLLVYILGGALTPLKLLRHVEWYANISMITQCRIRLISSIPRDFFFVMLQDSSTSCKSIHLQLRDSVYFLGFCRFQQEFLWRILNGFGWELWRVLASWG